jgi:hypothetical protein
MGKTGTSIPYARGDDWTLTVHGHILKEQVMFERTLTRMTGRVRTLSFCQSQFTGTGGFHFWPSCSRMALL